MWANWYMNQWDLFIENSVTPTKNCFKKTDEKSYAMFREIMQVLDTATLDVDTLQYQPRVLVASIMYLILSVHYEVLSVEDVVNRVAYYSDYLESSEFNALFSGFLEQSFSFELPELLPTIQYLCDLFRLPFAYDIPILNSKHQCYDDHYEEFLSFQTHNKNLLEFVGARIRSCKIN
jgi:hypothetical protein